MSLAFRAYFALPDTLATSTGVVTNAVHGFTSMLVYLIREHHPTALAVAFDAPGATFRDEILEDYKAGRAETPWLLPPQFDMIREVMAALAIPVMEAPGFEADDVIATLATEAAARADGGGHRHGGPRQLPARAGPVRPRPLQQARRQRLRALRRGGHLRALRRAPVAVRAAGVARGDPSDNLPGIPGVGEKTAAKLLTKYGDLDGIFAHLDEQTPKLRENLTENEELARSNARIIPLVLDVPLDVHIAQLTLGGWDRADGRGHVRPLRDEDGMEPSGGAARRRSLGEPVPGQRRPVGPRAPRRDRRRGGRARRRRSTPCHRPSTCARWRCPRRRADVTKQLGRARHRPPGAGRPLGRHARAQRPGGARPGGHRGRGGRSRRPGARRTCSAPPRWSKKLNSVLARPFVGHEVKEVDAVAPSARHRPHRPRHGHGRGGLPARRLDRRVRAVAAARADRPAQPRHRRTR